MKQIFVGWVPFQRRQVSMEKYFGFETVFVHRDFRRNWLKPFEYLVKGWDTLEICLRRKPDTVWVQVPPVPALTFVFLYKLLFRPTLRIVADCHNCMFRQPWSNVPSAAWHLNQCDLVVVHNDTVIDAARSLGVTRPVQVLEDAPAILGQYLIVEGPGEARKKIVFAASFAEDEPLREILQAARMTPELDFFITGNPGRNKGVHDLSDLPGNVRLTGFLPVDKFEKLFREADAILGLTKIEGIQLSVCNEAIGAGKPMVLSATTLLRRLFYKGAVYVDWTDPKSIAHGCRLAVSERHRLESEVRKLREERLQHWTKGQALAIQNFLSPPPRGYQRS